MMDKILGSSFFLSVTLVIGTHAFNIVSTTEQPNNSQNLADVVSNITERLDRLQWQNSQACQQTGESSSQNIVELQKSLKEIIEHLQKRSKSTSDYPTSCNAIKENGITQSGIYFIKPKTSSKPFTVYCDMDTKGGGWTYFLNRYDGSQDFFLFWDDYKYGFGGLTGEFWLGLEYLHHVTGSEINELLVELTDHDGKVVYALYDIFVVGSEAEGYRLKILGNYSGSAGDSMRHHAGKKFTTRDRDQDIRPGRNCAWDEHGGYWYGECTENNLTSRYFATPVQEGHRYGLMYWNSFRGSAYCLKKAKMMVRPRSVSS